MGVYLGVENPALPVLLRREADKTEETKKKEEKEVSGSVDQPLPLVPLPSEEAAEAAGIKVTAVEERDVGEYVTAFGEIDFDQNRYAHLSSRAAGTAWSVQKNAGDQVKKGEVLALIAAPELAKIKFDLQQTLLLVDTRARLLRRRRETKGAIAPQLVDEAEASLRKARIRLFGYQQSLQDLGLTVHHEDLAKLSEEEIAVRLRTLGIPDSLLQRLDAATLTSNLLPMYAPFDGVVVKRDIVTGEIVNTTTPQFVVADVRRLWLLLHVRLEDADPLAERQDVAFDLDGPGGKAPPTKVAWVSAEVDEKTRTVTVRADVPNPDGRLRPHTLGTGRILVGQARRRIVPNEALQFDGQSHLVFARGESATEYQPLRVKLGPRHDAFTEIVSGVRAGQLIATSGSHVLLSELLKKRIGGED